MLVIVEEIATKKRFVLLQNHTEDYSFDNHVSICDEKGKIYRKHFEYYKVVEIDEKPINEILK